MERWVQVPGYAVEDPARFGPLLGHAERSPISIAHYHDDYTSGDWWVSSTFWRTRHGQAIVARNDKGAVFVWRALMEDGRRVFCKRHQPIPGFGALSPLGRWRRRSDDGKGWQPGSVEFTSDDVLFFEGDRPNYVPTSDSGRLERIFAANERMMTLLQDDSFADTLVQLLRQNGVKTRTGQVVSQGDTEAPARIVARLRGLDEWYMDFQFGMAPAPPPFDRALIEAELARLECFLFYDPI